MSIKSLKDGYMVDIRPQGREGRRIRKKFPTKSEAQQYERWILSSQHGKEWLDRAPDKRPFSELIELWWRIKGQTMKSGESTRRKLERVDEAMGFPTTDRMNKNAWTEYRGTRYAAGIKAKTLNREQETLSSLFGTLIETGNYHHENPFKGVSPLKVHAHEMGYLLKSQINQLLTTLPEPENLAARLSLATGARWGEVVKLRRTHLAHSKAMFINTKNSKNRTVPVSNALFDELCERGTGDIFADVDYELLRRTIKQVAPDLPDGQGVHVLRHTFASHFMMNGGNILTLQKILGHSNIQQTMVYAHLAPDYLQDAVRFNPLEN